jgi:hypothetical protein
MDFPKKHYEKILLSVVLLGLAGTAVWMFIAIDKKREEVNVLIPPLGDKKIPALDLSNYEKGLEKMQNPPRADFSLPHHLFNPVIWKQRSDGNLFKFISADLPRLLETKPLHLTITYKRTSGTGSNITGYTFSVAREAAARPAERRPVERYVSATGKRDTDLFSVKDVQGPAESPTSFAIQLNDTKQEIVITPSQPYKRVEGYAADLRYDVENKQFNDMRVGSVMSFGGETYKVIAITQNEVTVQANSNQKQTTIRAKPAP